MKIDELFIALGFKVESAQLNKANQALEKLGDKGSRVNTTLAGLGTRMASVAKVGAVALTGAAIGAAYGLQRMVSSQLDAASTAVDMAKAFGTTAETIQELKFAAEQSGTSIESVAGAMKTMAKAGDAFRKSGTPANSALKSMGINGKAFADLPLEKRLEVLADGLSQLPEGPRQLEAAIKVAGSNAESLMPLLLSGAEGIRALRKEAEQFTIKEDAAQGLAAVNSNLGLAKAKLAGVAGQIAAKLLPVLEPLTNATLAFLDENGAAIAKAIGDAMARVFEFVGNIVSVVDSLIDGFGETGFLSDQFGQYIKKGKEAVDALWQALKPVAKVLGFIAKVALSLILPAMIKVLDVITVALKAVGDIFTAIYNLPSEIGKAIDGLWEGIKKIPALISKAIDDLIDNVAGIPGRIKDALGSTVGGLLGFDDKPIGVQVRRDNSIDNAVNSFAAKFSRAPTLPASATQGAGVGNVANVTVNANGANPIEVARMVVKKIDEAFANQSRDLSAAAGAI